MHAPQNEATGTSGQSFVKGEFEEIGWGAVANPDHDLGTDLWLMARDENRFDLQALVGAQVKTGNSYFERPEKDQASGDLVGWWYAEENDDHFDYWSEHTVPHILVLRSVKTKTSYWVHVTSETIQSTGKGNKILVPASQTVGESDRDALTSVATRPSRSASLDGRAWGSSWKVPRSDRLRYALIAPRLVAPHPNRSRVNPDAIEALAMLMQGRFSELQDLASPEKHKKSPDASDTETWVWKLFDATWDWIVTADLSKLEALPLPEETTHLVAAAALRAAAFIEFDRPEAALAAVRAAQSKEGLGTVDIAWLKSHEARNLVELGQMEEAQDLALEVQKLRSVAPSDPTARALVAVTTAIVFNMSYGAQDIGELIQSIDTSTRWWRAQTIATGLEKYFDEQFKDWGRDSSVTFFASDTVWTTLRSATLLAGVAADHGGWRHTMSLLARWELMKTTDAEVISSALTDLMSAGAKKKLVLAVSKLSVDGPVAPLVTVANRLDLASTPRSSLESALAFLRHAGDLVDSTNADRHAEWLLGALQNPKELQERLKPGFLVERAILEALSWLMHSMSPEGVRLVIDHILNLPVVDDQGVAGLYGRIVASVHEDDWSEDDLASLASRTGDNWELQDDIHDLVASRDPGFRTGLLEKIKQGDLAALSSFGDVADLPQDVADGAIAHMATGIEGRIKQTRTGMYGIGGPDLGHALVLLNVSHPTVARWEKINELLSEPDSHPTHIIGPLRALGELADRLPDFEKESLNTILEDITKRPDYDRSVTMIPLDLSPQAAAKLALLRIFPEKLTDSTVQELLAGSGSDRKVVARIAGDRTTPDDRNLLFVLARDPDPKVRAAAIGSLAKRAAREGAPPEAVSTIRDLVEKGGPLTAKWLSGYLLDAPESEARSALLRSLADHPSAVVRGRVVAGLAGDQSSLR